MIDVAILLIMIPSALDTADIQNRKTRKAKVQRVMSVNINSGLVSSGINSRLSLGKAELQIRVCVYEGCEHELR